MLNIKGLLVIRCCILEFFIFDVWVVMIELKKIRIYYVIKKGLFWGKEIELFKDGVCIWYRNMLLNGGNLDGNYFMISFELLIINYRGNYFCVVINVVGSV